MSLEVRSPQNERDSIQIPAAAANVSTPFNGTVCSAQGDEYIIENNIVDLITGDKPYSFAQSTNHWNLTASVYEDLWRKRSLSILTGEPFPIQKEKELLVKWIAPKPGKTYLDIGCSTALYARALKKAEPQSSVVALDFSTPMLQEARFKAEAEQTDMYLIRADGRDLPFFGKSFHGIAMGGTLNELTDELKVLYECRRALTDDGVLFMMHLIKSEVWYGRLLQQSAELSGIQFWSLDESNELFQRAGFRVDEQFHKGIVCFSKLLPV